MLGRNLLLSLLTHVLNLISSVHGAVWEPLVKNVHGFFDTHAECVTLVETAETFAQLQ
jgi:hypothetical protein